MRYTGYLLFLMFFICLHAMAMSEGIDNTTEKIPIYGFSPDRSRWNNYAIDIDNTIYFFDTKSVIKQNNKVKVWIKFGGPINDDNISYLYMETSALKEIDCNARLIRSIEWNYFSMQGSYNKYTTPTKWENIEPETAEDALLDEVCAQPKKGKKR